MVGLNPAKFYGRLLPRPRIYCDVKFSDSRVDPPESVNGAFLEWASEASWKMGGTATKRKRMSGRVEGRLNKLRDMDESEEDDETPPPKKVPVKLSFGKKKSEKKRSPAPDLEKHRTPIEKMLESPGHGEASKRGRLAPRRIIPDDDSEEQAPVAKAGARRSRTEQPLPDTDDDSDDDLEGFMQRLEAEKNTPTRTIRKSTRLQASPTVSQTPDSKRPSKNAPESGDGRRTPRRSPLSSNRKRVVEDSESSDEESQSVFL